VISFKSILARAEKRKGGPKELAKCLSACPDAAALTRLPDDRILAEMTKRIFSAGFAWSVIEQKWPDFETAFLGFAPARLAFQPDDFWHALLGDKRIVRNSAKIMSVRENAQFVQAIAGEHGSFGKFLNHWPATDQIGLLALLNKRGSRLGGNTGQMFLRFVGWDGFVTSKDVVACLRDAGIDIAEEVKSKSDLAKVQAAFNAWAEETKLPYAHLSRICALSVGENMGT
jgi:3-methyladenine DNA glycosylase Tag